MGDTSHPRKNEIYQELEKLKAELHQAGHKSDTTWVTKNILEEEKEHDLCLHSEKVALAFGMISTPSNTPLLLAQNLRICGDCHSATKLISKIRSRKIIMRDNNCFHHFVDGECSCNDYW